MNAVNRRHLGTLLVAGGAFVALAGCAAQSAAIQAAIVTAENGVKKFVTTVTTDLPSLVVQWSTIKGIGQVAVAALALVNPTAAASITAAMGLGDAAIAFLTSAPVTTAAATIQSNVQTVLDNIGNILTASQGAFTAVKATV